MKKTGHDKVWHGVENRIVLTLKKSGATQKKKKKKKVVTFTVKFFLGTKWTL